MMCSITDPRPKYIQTNLSKEMNRKEKKNKTIKIEQSAQVVSDKVLLCKACFPLTKAIISLSFLCASMH